ncbi:MAG: protein-L-isoaspartate O-methyltransferase [Thiohalomonadales bacterium]
MDKVSTEQARFNMIEQQIRPAEVLDPHVLDVISSVPRELYVPKEYKQLAFADISIPIEHQQTMMSPIMEARLLQALSITSTDKILEIGTGSGFLTALLAKLGRHVWSLEIYESLKNSAEKRLAEQNVDNVTILNQDGVQGWPDEAPYDVIAVTGSLPLHTDVLENQLAINGRLFVVEGEQPNMSVNLIKRIAATEFQRECLFETVLPALENVEMPQKFVF